MGTKIAISNFDMYTLDTNAIIYYLKNETATVLILNNFFAQNMPLYVSSITELELFSFSGMNIDEIEKIETLLKTVAAISLDSRLARIAGSLRRNYGVALPDSAVAATALFTGTTLVTRNARDFRKVSGLSVLKI